MHQRTLEERFSSALVVLLSAANVLTAVLESATRQRVLFEAKLSGPLQRQQRQSTVHLETSTPRPPSGRGESEPEPPDSAGSIAPPPPTRRRSSKRITFAEPATAASPPAEEGDSDGDAEGAALAGPQTYQPPDILRIEPPEEGLAESDEELLEAALAAAAAEADSERRPEEEADRSISVISSSVSLAGTLPL